MYNSACETRHLTLLEWNNIEINQNSCYKIHSISSLNFFILFYEIEKILQVLGDKQQHKTHVNYTWI